MVNVEVEFSDKEYALFDKLKMHGDTPPDILKKVFFHCLSEIPDLNKELESIKLSDNIDFVRQNLDNLYAAYEDTSEPLAEWDDKKFGDITTTLSELQVFRTVVSGEVNIATPFRHLWERTFNMLVNDYDNVDEYDAVAMATLFSLNDFSEGALDADMLCDCALYLMEVWFIRYAHTLKLSKETGNRRYSKPLSYDPIVPKPIL
ncbi:MAG: hypothetical protein KAH86_02295 [Methanosarcinales archaeon]|nr:hypothetical protein [Methanosarcinales archaeon]